MSDIISVANEIHNKVKLLEKMRLEIKSRGKFRARYSAVYDKALAVTIMKLRNGVEMEHDGAIIKDPPVTILDKIAKGICWKYKLRMDESDAEYKSITSNIKTVEAELTGLQSINKHLEYSGRK